MNQLYFAQQAPAKHEVEMMVTHKEEAAMLCHRRRVSFSSTPSVIDIQKQAAPLSHQWYSRKESSCMKRECAVLSKHYKLLAERVRSNPEELLGLEEAAVMRQRSSKRKMTVQSILLQQEIHKACKINDLSKIANMSASYSNPARKEAFARATRLPFETYQHHYYEEEDEEGDEEGEEDEGEEEESTCSSLESMEDDSMAGNTAGHLSMNSSQANITTPSIISFAYTTALHRGNSNTRTTSFPTSVSLKRELSHTGWDDDDDRFRLQRQLDRFQGGRTGIQTENAVRIA